MDRVERTLAETAVVSSVLAGVFVEDDGPDPSPDEGAEAPTVAIGLDASHARLLQALAGRAEISRQEFEEMAETFNLLPDGAFETLNEVAFERVGTPLFEGDDPIEIDLETLGEMMQ